MKLRIIMALLLTTFIAQANQITHITSSPLISSTEDYMAKFEVLKEEVIEHVTNQEIIEPSDSLISFLKEARKKYKGMKDIEILERFITGAI